MKMLGYSLLLMTLNVHALVPVEGILMGEAELEYQQDPLTRIFTQTFEKPLPEESARLKKFQSIYEEGYLLMNSCSKHEEPRYFSQGQLQTVRRSVAATLQYIGIDSAIKTIATYARKNEMSEENYQRLSSNLVKNFCSKNITIISLKNIEKSFGHYFEHPVPEMLPTVVASPFVSQNIKEATESLQARSREFDTAIRMFRSFCSWGGDVADYRMLAPYLKSPFIQGMLISKMSRNDDEGFKVVCRDLVCRKAIELEFTRFFPTTMGSTGIVSDLEKQYCSHFRLLDYEPKRTIENVAEWIKKSELEAPLFETGFFISLMTGVPDFMFAVNKYSDLPLLLKGPVDERWNLWAKNSVNSFSHDLYYEESLRVRAEPRRNVAQIKYEGFKINFDVTLGEIDRLLKDKDKISLSFDLNLPKNYLRNMRSEWISMQKHLASEEEKTAFLEKNARYIGVYLAPKEKLFQQKMWNDQFPRLVSHELLEQVLRYEGDAFESYKDEMINVPVTFSYGVFALNYLRYRSDVQKGRLKVNL
jgi:hypothetical protein